MKSAQHATATMFTFLMGYSGCSMVCLAQVIFTMNRKKGEKPGAILHSQVPTHPMLQFPLLLGVIDFRAPFFWLQILRATRGPVNWTLSKAVLDAMMPTGEGKKKTSWLGEGARQHHK
jgi:hypothetical protein